MREFWQRYPESENPLRAWFKTASAAEWENFQNVKAVYSTADRVAQYTIFNIGGNKWRLITVIHYNTSRVYVRHVYTHAEYDKWNDMLRKAKRK